MTPADLAIWRADMGLSQRAAAAALGVAQSTYQAMERGAAWGTGRAMGIDLRTALACAAIRAGLVPEGATTSTPP